MGSVAATLALIGGAISLLLAIGAGLGLIRSSYNKARIQALREDNDDLRHRVDDNDKELVKAKAREDALELRCNHLESENELLKALVTQRAEVSAVAMKLDEHHNQAMAAWAEMTTAIREINP